VIKINLIETLILIFLLVTVVLNTIAEPKLSFEYYKSFFNTGKKVVVWCINFVRGVIDGFRTEGTDSKGAG